MNKKIIILFCILYSNCGYCIDVPQSGRYDNRIKYVDYNIDDVVNLTLLPGLGSRIVLSKEESITDIASGFTNGWEFKPRNNILYIKPKSIKIGEGNNSEIIEPEPGTWNTNVMVTTDKRLYDFDLVLLPGGSNSETSNTDRNVTYRVVFRYPDEEYLEYLEAIKTRAIKDKMEAKNIPVNWEYTMDIGKESESIAPTMVYDNGRFTFLKFPNNREFPTIFIVFDDGSEGIINTHVDEKDKELLVVHRVAKQFMLRLGSSVVGVYNESFDLDGIPPTSGTTIPNVTREIRKGSNSE